ncbi:MAG: hypothetical protein CL438_02470 [Acidimicrobiaceae bacterium]|nr:hypothetical protein [Acidimicrobiaceae bacterium]
MADVEPPIPDPMEQSEPAKQKKIIYGFLLVLIGGAVLLGILLAGDNSSNETVIASSKPTEVQAAPTTIPEEESSQTEEPIGTPSSTPQERFETGAVEIIGEALPPDESVGHVAPGFKAQPNTSAEMIEIQPDDGTIRLIGFFAHWCPHCQREVPRVAQWLNENGLPNGVEVVAISTSVREGTPNYPPSEWFEAENWPTQVLVDSSEKTIAAAYGLTGFPFWVLVDGEGFVVHRSSGELTEEQFAYLVYLAGTLAPQLA